MEAAATKTQKRTSSTASENGESKEMHLLEVSGVYWGVGEY